MPTCLQDTNAKLERGEFPDTSSFQSIYDKLRSIRDEDGMSWCSNCHVVWDAIFPESERFDMGMQEVCILYPCTQEEADDV